MAPLKVPAPASASWRAKLYEIIFEAETPAGKAFDVILIILVLLSVMSVGLESVREIRADYGQILLTLEWIFTLIFTVEFFLRVICVRRPLDYIGSFFGVVDLLAILPTYLSILVPGAQSLLVVRAFRLIRVFRVFKLTTHLGQANLLYNALRASRPKITVFLTAVLSTVLIIGALMYLVEGEESGFTSIPTAVYWAIVTMTTVGYGDIAPKTPAGQTLASALMITGYGIIAVPTGIVTTELMRASRSDGRGCPNCGLDGHELDALHCKYCGARLSG